MTYLFALIPFSLFLSKSVILFFLWVVTTLLYIANKHGVGTAVGAKKYHTHGGTIGVFVVPLGHSLGVLQFLFIEGTWLCKYFPPLVAEGLLAEVRWIQAWILGTMFEFKETGLVDLSFSSRKTTEILATCAVL
jgi:hypothetical protein